MDRKNYWNEKYLEYWKSRVAEQGDDASKSRIIAGDALVPGDDIYLKVFEEFPFSPGNVLEVGCAWGRWFPIYKKNNLDIYGVDISEAMIGNASKLWGDDNSVKELREAEAEKLPYENDFFDNVTCLAVFDATYQNHALQEMFRVLKPDGHLYLTGKNTNYRSDDNLALEAEEGARKKNHPNFFTNTPLMIECVQKGGGRLLSSFYFEKRGDFSKSKFQKTMPTAFYEYLLIFQKQNEVSAYPVFSDDYSMTYRKVNGS